MFDDLLPPAESATPLPPTPLRRLEAMLKDGSLARANDQKRLGSSLERANAALKEADLAGRLGGLIPIASAPSFALQDAQAVLGWLRDMAAAAKTVEAASSPDLLAQLPGVVRQANRQREDVERAMKLAWQRSIEQSFADATKLAKLLLLFAGSQAVGKRIQDAAAEGIALKGTFPPSTEQVARIKDLIDTINTSLGELQQQEETKDLLDFLSRVLGGTATLAHVTPKLYSWLSANNALGLLKVTF